MPPTTRMKPKLSGWRCSQCAHRSLSTTSRRMAVGPEHPRYVEIPEPPQQSVPYKPPVKGVLPVPRNVFAGSPRDQSTDNAIAEATKFPIKEKTPAPGSREEWKQKMGDARRRNLYDGLKSLRARQTRDRERASARSEARQAAREELLHAPEREDERLTAPSNTLDVESLLKGSVQDPTRNERLMIKARNLANHTAAKEAARQDALHTLYMNARDFIVTPKQLDDALEMAFGTPEAPVQFMGYQQTYDGMAATNRSIWAKGKPTSVQDMFNMANTGKSRGAMGGANVGYQAVNKERIRRIAEKLTGGKMDD